MRANENHAACWCATVEAETDRTRRVAAGKIGGSCWAVSTVLQGPSVDFDVFC